jgi:hypothetical protein
MGRVPMLWVSAGTTAHCDVAARRLIEQLFVPAFDTRGWRTGTTAPPISAARGRST